MLAAFTRLHPKLIDLSLGRMERLLDALGRPHLALPPVIHIAGTNGKGSVLANLSAMAAAQGLAAHAYVSPHLVRFNERIVLRGSPIDDAALLDVLQRTEAANEGAPVTFFEATTAAAFLAFSEVPADLLILETGLGGRLDATNVVPDPAVAVLTSISLDHQDFLGSDLAGIAAEKAAILKPGAAAICAPQVPEVQAVIDARADALGIQAECGGRDWEVARQGDGLLWRDRVDGASLTLPLPALTGPHQAVNAGVAVAAARAFGRGPRRLDGTGRDPVAAPRDLPRFAPAAIAAGLAAADWPGRMQRVDCPALPAAEVWLDGGHNPAAGVVLADALAAMPADGRPLWLVVGMKPNKDAGAYLAPLAARAAGLLAVPIPGESCWPPQDLAGTALTQGFAAAQPADGVAEALARLAATAPDARVVICGSLYLVGAVLAESVAVPIRARSAAAAR